MDRRRIYFLIASFVALMPGGCGEWQELPIRLYIDSTFSELERQAVLDAVAEWNERAGGRYAYGDAVFDVVGDIEDTFDHGDYEDGRHAIYRITHCNPDEAFLQETYWGEHEGVTIGYCTLGDCIDILFYFDVFIAVYQANQELRVLEFGAEIDLTGRFDTLRYNYVRNLTLHELGHMIGITHYNHRDGVMNSDGLGYLSPLEHLTDADLDAFCEIYPCR